MNNMIITLTLMETYSSQRTGKAFPNIQQTSPKSKQPPTKHPSSQKSLIGKLFSLAILHQQYSYCYFLLSIIYRFNNLDDQQKIQSTIITNTSFLQNLLQLKQTKWEHGPLYHLPSLKTIRFLDQPLTHRSPFFNQLIQTLRVSWTTQPLLWIDKNRQILSGLLNWMQNVSNRNIFEYAHKISDKNDPQQNLLWFNLHSFRPLEQWIVNELQKSIIKNYFNKTSTLSNHLQFINYLRDKGYTQQLILLNIPFLISHSSQFHSIERQSLKKIQESYRQHLTFTIIQDIEIKINKVNKKKSKKKSKKKNNQENINIKEIQQSTQQQSEGSQNKISDEVEKQQHQLTTVITHQLSNLNQSSKQQQLSISSNNHDITFQHQNKYKQRPLSLSSQNNKSHTEITSQQSIKQPQHWEQDMQQSCQKKRKKKHNKKNNIQIVSPYKQLSNKTCSMMVNRQLNNFIDSLSIQTNSLYDTKVAAFQRIRYFVKGFFPSAEMVLFGSNAVGLSLPTSDIDIMLINLPCRCRQQANEILAQIAIEINTMAWIQSCSTYLNAKVPIVKLEVDLLIPYMQRKRKSDEIMVIDPMVAYYLEVKDKMKSKTIKVDLAINFIEDKHMGTQSTQLMRNWMTKYPTMHRILLAMKYILSHRGFNENFKGGIGSYCLFVMVASYIKQNQSKGIQIEEEGQLFINILKFYGQQFQNQLKSINLVSQGSCFQPLSTLHYFSDNLHKSLLQIYDPINNRHMSGSCSQYNSVKAEFRRIRNSILDEQSAIQKQLMLAYTASQAAKLIQNKKAIGRWIHKYQIRSGFQIQKVIDGGI